MKHAAKKEKHGMQQCQWKFQEILIFLCHKISDLLTDDMSQWPFDVCSFCILSELQTIFWWPINKVQDHFLWFNHLIFQLWYLYGDWSIWFAGICMVSEGRHDLRFLFQNPLEMNKKIPNPSLTQPNNGFLNLFKQFWGNESM